MDNTKYVNKMKTEHPSLRIFLLNLLTKLAKEVKLGGIQHIPPKLLNAVKSHGSSIRKS